MFRPNWFVIVHMQYLVDTRRLFNILIYYIKTKKKAISRTMSKRFEGFSRSVGQIINRWKLLLRSLRSWTPLLALLSQNYPCGHAEGETITHFPHHSHLPQHRTVQLLVGICTQIFISQSLGFFQAGWCYIFCSILTTWEIYSLLHILDFPPGSLPSWTNLKLFHMNLI